MFYYLHHYFDPDFDPGRSRPRESETGRVDHRNLGIVQNVVAGQVLARFVKVDQEKAAQLDSRFLFDTPSVPLGPHCRMNPEDPLQIIADVNGCVLYKGGRITVGPVLAIPGDIDLSTGNILFVGDLVVRKNVRSGFEVMARNVLVKGMVEAARVHADIGAAVTGGIKGADKARITAGTNIRAGFCEKAVLEAGEAIMINGSCLHSDLHAGEKLAVKGRLQGGATYCGKLAYVGEQVGGGTSTVTQVHLGYPPHLMLRVHDLEESLAREADRLKDLENQALLSQEVGEELAPRLQRCHKRINVFKKQLVDTWGKIEASEHLGASRLVVPGQVKPGLEISIGPVSLRVQDYHENVQFRLVGDEIKMFSPAVQR